MEGEAEHSSVARRNLATVVDWAVEGRNVGVADVEVAVIGGRTGSGSEVIVFEGSRS